MEGRRRDRPQSRSPSTVKSNAMELLLRLRHEVLVALPPRPLTSTAVHVGFAPSGRRTRSRRTPMPMTLACRLRTPGLAATTTAPVAGATGPSLAPAAPTPPLPSEPGTAAA